MELIRDIKLDDLQQVAKIHKEQFKGHYLGNFSPKLLLHFYKSFLDNVDIIFIVYENEGEIKGFIVGGNLHIINNATSNFMKKNIPLYVWEILLRPHTWIDSLRKLYTTLFKKKVSPNSLDAIMDYTLLSIAVSSDSQGLGVASKLIEEFDVLIKKHTNKYFLSVHDNNNRALSFYVKMGFSEERHFDNEVQFVKEV